MIKSNIDLLPGVEKNNNIDLHSVHNSQKHYTLTT